MLYVTDFIWDQVLKKNTQAVLMRYFQTDWLKHTE